VKAVDTNILIRLIVRDDVDQFSRAIDFCSGGVIISLTVAMEIEWVLRSRYSMPRDAVVESFSVLLEGAEFHFDRANMVSWALDRYAKGADFADMIHLVDSSNASGFATFDAALSNNAGTDSPLPIFLI
jgi:predicted nucleic-acid-binding protein